MREILFRGKRRSGDGWAYGSLIKTDIFCCILEVDTEEDFDYPYLDDDLGIIDGNVTPVIPETVGEFTGRCDNNGVKIFEGDIIKCEVAYEVGCYPHTETIIREVKYGVAHPLHYCDNPEVIGNIHDNPELLVKEK